MKLTGGGRVTVRHVGGGGDAWSKGKTEAAGLSTLGRDVFLATYVQKDQLAAGETRGGRSFRRYASKVGAAPPAPSEELVNGAAARPSKPPELVARVETITPDLARSWLDRGGPNRKLSERRVDLLVHAIRNDQWQLTGEAIILDAEGRVRNGQHRLEAIFRSGQPVQTLVVRNVHEDSFTVMDTGRSRSGADVLGMHGIANRIATASAARTLILIERFGRPYASSFRDPAASPTNRDQLDYVLAHRAEIEHAIRMSTNLYHAGFIGGVGLWGAALTLLLRVDEAATEEFVERLIQGDNLTRDSSILKLRNLLLAANASWDGSARGRESLVALVIKAWNYWRRGEGIGQLSWRSEGRAAEPFPTPE